LRGIPSDVVREAKAVAARRGVTLAGFVADTLARAVREPEVEAARPATSEDLDDEMRWYERNRDKLVREHDGEYIAILGNRVVDHDEDFEELAQRVFKREGVRNIFMPRVGAGERTLRVRSPRVARRELVQTGSNAARRVQR
jgi:hypothetical protein